MSSSAHTKAPPCAVVIFGATGDLAQRKLFPAFHNLRKEGLLPDEFVLIENGRRKLSPSGVKQHVADVLNRFIPKESLDPAARDWLMERTVYVAGDPAQPETYPLLRDSIDSVSRERGTGGNVLFYLATPPSLFEQIPEHLSAAGLLEESRGWRRIVIEKPFGHNWESACALNRKLRSVLREEQIYRIDHYLGKDTVQNIMVLRFANGIFEPIWNNHYIDSVQITVAETLGVESRGGYYESSGALRDMVPNHLFQLVSLIAMEPPNSFVADDIRDEKVKVLKAIRPPTPEEVLSHAIRGQYGAGTVDGEPVIAYRSEPAVKPDSQAETFVALKLGIDNWRWAGVPFYLRTGKRLPNRLTEVVIHFRCAPFQMFRGVSAEPPSRNLLVLQIQPEERIQTRFTAKIPGLGIDLADALMDFNYVDRFGSSPQSGYETLLIDCMKGDATLFQRADQIETGWEIVEPILDVWRALPARDFPNYRAGTWGPARAGELLALDGRRWTAINCADSACYLSGSRSAA